MRCRSPKDEVELIRAVTEWERCAKDQSSCFRPYDRERNDDYRYYHRQFNERKFGENVDRGYEPGVRKGYDDRWVQHKPSIKREETVPTCFSYGIIGHKSPDCPKKVKNVVKAVRLDKESQLSTELGGNVAGKPCVVILDTGANISVVGKQLVSADSYTEGMYHYSILTVLLKDLTPQQRSGAMSGGTPFWWRLLSRRHSMMRCFLEGTCQETFFSPFSTMHSHHLSRSERLKKRSRLALEAELLQHEARDGAQPFSTEAITQPTTEPEQDVDTPTEDGEELCRVKGNDGFEVEVLTEVLEEAERNKLRQ